ncbi:Uma2 family endonuclease [Granulicella paludicola]|uniref:Uma2 family endonuclease n=1 Tax=Granulicella paludicola TaxID=474951 RepID=UPI0021E0E881|nr:Uma2 family endonuclease [Granulicella paludicola]
MASSVLVPLHEYLATIYEPDRDYVDGELKERNMGEQPHAAIQGMIARIFGTRRIEWDIRVLPEQRVQISKTRYRIPDICILRRSDPKDRIVNWAPLLCIEVLSEEDRLQEMQTKVNEFEALGTRDIWVIDPWKRVAYYASSNGFQRVTDDLLRVQGTPIELSLTALFAELDEE